MATKLKDLRFGDYTLKGTSNSGGGTSFSLGANDTIDVQGYGTILSYSSESGVWTFNGTADYVTYGIPGVLGMDGCGNWNFDGYAKYVTDGISGVLEKDGCGNWTFDGTASSCSSCSSIPGVLYEGGCGSYELHVPYAYIDAISISGNLYRLSVDNGFVKATAVSP